MENIISISKDMPEYGRVQKCMTAIAKADYSLVTREDFDAALDAVAKSVSEEYAIPYSEAYQSVLTGETGKALYDARAECPPTGAGPVMKSEGEAEAIAKAESMERDAARFSESYGVPLADARKQVADFYQQNQQ